jgi:thermolysin
VAEDIVGGPGVRSLADPAATGHPDHISGLTRSQDDNGGVHRNATIAGHAFFLAIEGGTNRTSGEVVRGVGGDRRGDVERAFYRAFVYLLPMSADFTTARAATIQSACDLYGADSVAAAAIARAWDAVGVR